MKKLGIFDIDGVIYGSHIIFDQIQDQEENGVIAKGTWDKILILINEYQKGVKNYQQAGNEMLRVYAEALKGRNYEEIVDQTYKFLEKNKDRFFPYFGKLIPQIKSKYNIYLVTTNFQFGCDAVARLFETDGYLSSVAGVRDGVFTGEVELSLAGNKSVVSGLVSKYGYEGSFAVGDSENDADMLDKVQNPFVMEPNEKLMDIASQRGWKIVDRDNISDSILSLV